MPKDKAPPGKREKPTSDGGWKSWVRDIAIAVLIMAILLGAIFAYTGVWPPLVVVESSSMQHSSAESYVGVIDTGDLVFVQNAPTRADVITYIQARVTGYTTYGDYGDVIIFRLHNRPQDTPIIHRAIMYVIPNGSAGTTAFADIPDLKQLPTADWIGTDGGGNPTHVPYHMEAVQIFDVGYRHLNITFNFGGLLQFWSQGPGYLTMGDHNAPTYDTSWFPSQADIIGHARGEIPWFGLIKLILSPASGPGGCCQGWGDPNAPGNSWSALAISLVFLVALPFLLEAAAWAWGKYAWPRIKPRLPHWRKRSEPEPSEDVADEDAGDEPREGSSGP